MAKRPGTPGSPERRAAYRREYEQRIALGQARGLTPARSVGKRKRKEPTLGLAGLDLRFKGIWEKLKRLILPDVGGGGRPLPTYGNPDEPTSTDGEPSGVGHVIMFIGANDAIAVYPDGRRERGSIDQVWQNAKDSGLATEVSTDEPPPRTLFRCYASQTPTPTSVVHYTADNSRTLCNRPATLLTDKPVTCLRCLTENAKESSL